MFDFRHEEISPGTTRYRICLDGTYLTFRSWIQQLKNSERFVRSYVQALQDSPYPAFFWEVKPIKLQDIDQAFEYVLVHSDSLPGIIANSNSFKDYFGADEAVVSFPNLSGDALLVVPTQLSDESNYNHLATFVRNAPHTQVVNFWQKVAVEYEKLIGVETKWLSTAGLGVYWLHVRIDSRPKYYRHGAYRH